jgi:HPt (histidine-containing phosphotransfer) domain-containing protein
MDDTLTKPVDFGDLDTVIGNWLPAAARLRTRIDLPDATDRGRAGLEDRTDVLDVTPLLEAFGEIDDDALAFLGEFIESAGAKVQTILKNIDDLNVDELADLVHSLKGESLTFGGTKLGRLLEEFEVEMRGVADLRHRKLEIDREWKTLTEAAERLVRGEADREHPDDHPDLAAARRKREAI